MRTVITGGSGFIGSAIAIYLAKQGHEVFVITRRPDFAWRLLGFRSIKVLGFDLNDQEAVEEAFSGIKPQVVIHAAWDGMTREKRNSFSQINNLLAAQHVLQAAGKNGCGIFIGIGSQEEYGVYNRKIDEQVLATPGSLYGVYKLGAAYAGMHFSRIYGFKYAWLRLFSAFGPGDVEEYIIPYAIKGFLSGTQVKFSSCLQQWDYLYVNDIPFLIEKVLNAQSHFCGIYNLCSGDVHLLRDIVLTLKGLTNAQVDPYFADKPLDSKTLIYLQGDNMKFKNAFGWVQMKDFNNALEETVQWFRQTGLALTK